MHVIEDITASYGGQVLKYLGDGVKICFGHRKAHEDHAYRAVRAGAAIIDECNKMVAIEFPGLTYQGLRVGIHSGYVDLVESKTNKHSVPDTFGLTTNLAAKLEEAAPLNHLCYSEATHNLVSKFINAKRYRSISVGQGISPISSFILSADQAFVINDISPLNQSNTNMIGRDEQLEILKSLLNFNDTRNKGSILLKADGGMGKTRLMETLSHYIFARSVSHTIIRALDVMKKIPFYFARQLIENVDLELIDLNSAEKQALNIIKHMNIGEIRNWRMADHDKVIQISNGIIKVIQHQTSNDPFLLFIEDIHFFDQESLRLLDKLVKYSADSVNFKILASSRPTFTDEFYSIFAHIEDVKPLNKNEAEKLIRSLFDGYDVEYPSSLLSKIINLADGNPFILTEITKLERKKLIRGGEETLPVSLEPILKGRLATIDPDGLDIVKVLALYGREIKIELLENIVAWDQSRFQAALKNIKMSEVVLIHTNGALNFVHDLYRVHCVQSLLSDEKKSIHGRIYDTLLSEKNMQDTSEETQLLARHAFGAGYEEAGIDHMRQVFSTANSVGAIRTVRQLFLQACVYCDGLSNSRYHKAKFAMLSFDATHRLAQEQELLSVYLDALSHCKDQFTPFEIIVLKSQLSVIYWTKGEVEMGIPHAHDALLMSQEQHHLGLECISLYSLACLEFASGFLHSAIERISNFIKKIPDELKGKKWGQSVSYPTVILQTFGAWFAIDAGNYDLSQQFLSKADEIEADFPNVYGRVLCLMGKGYLHYRKNDFLQSVHFLEQAYQIAEKEAFSLAPMGAAWLCLALIELGRHDQALQIINYEYTTARSRTLKNANEGYLLIAKAKLLGAMHDYDKARIVLDKAIQYSQSRNDLITQAYSYASYIDISAPTNDVDVMSIRHLKKALALAKECGMEPLITQCEKKLREKAEKL